MKSLITFIGNQGINYSEIWNDTGFIFCLVLFSIYLLLVIWASRNYRNSVFSEAKESVNLVNLELEMLAKRNNELSELIDNLNKKLLKFNRERNSKGQFFKDWTKATEDELIKEARKRYPIGTKIGSMGTSYDSIHTITWRNIIHGGKNEPKFSFGSIFCGATNNVVSNWMDCTLYKNGVWAKIIKTK